MGRHKAILLGSTMLAAGISGPRQDDTKTLRNYRNADDTPFIVALYDGDRRASSR
ncbi:hypothetical protein ABIA96_001843 [Bradyrhizobium sp. LB11.1]